MVEDKKYSSFQEEYKESENSTEKNEYIKKDISESLNEILLVYEKGEINEKNCEDYFKKISKIEIKNEIEHKIYSKISTFLYELELKRNNLSTFEKLKQFEEKLNRKTGNIKAEILTMMGLFFALFTFIQINLTFTLQFIEKYSGYRVILFICIINMILLLMLSFIMEIIGAIVYGENLVRIRDGDKKYWKFFPESKLKIKRTFVFSIIFLLIIAMFSFYKENDKEILKYEALQKEFENYKEIDANIDRVIEDKLKNKKIGKLNEIELENLKKEIKLEILQNREYKEN